MKTIKPITLTDDEKHEVTWLIYSRLSFSDTDPCVHFTGKWHDGKGYKKFRYKGRAYYVHRVTYYLYYGEPPSGHVIDHKCRNPGCVNPLHLEAVSVKDNTERGNGKWIFEQGYSNDHNSNHEKHDCVGQSNNERNSSFENSQPEGIHDR